MIRDNRCPFCGERNVVIGVQDNEVEVQTKSLSNTIEILQDKIKLQEEVIREQIKLIYDYVKAK